MANKKQFTHCVVIVTFNDPTRDGPSKINMTFHNRDEALEFRDRVSKLKRVTDVDLSPNFHSYRTADEAMEFISFWVGVDA